MCASHRHIIDQPRLADLRRHQQSNRTIAARRDRRQGLRVSRLQIIECEAGIGDRLAPGRQHRVDRLAGADIACALLERAVEHGRRGAILRREIDVARGAGEAVALAHRRNADHRDAEIEILRHLRDDTQLLIILLAEQREVGPHLREQLGDHGGDAAEEMRPILVLEPGERGAFRRDAGGEAVRIHRLGGRRPDHVDLLRAQCGNVGGEGARIGAEIFMGSKLRRVDEDRHHDAPRAPARLAHQFQMAGVQRAHGRDQRDGLPGAAERVEGATERRAGAGDDRALGDDWSLGHEGGSHAGQRDTIKVLRCRKPADS